jgi:uncharacterized protein with ATP-grasp and redox domains
VTGPGHTLPDGEPLPPLLMTSDKDSFARETFKIRIPRIIEEVISTNQYSQQVKADLLALRQEILSGQVRPLVEDRADAERWNLQARPYLGRTWLDLPWYFAEVYFYRRLLEAVSYFRPGEWHLRDPFQNTKARELQPEAGPARVKDILQQISALPAQEAIQLLIYASLWGNQADLSNKEVADLSRGSGAFRANREHLIVDEIATALGLLGPGSSRRIALICDNAGTEILLDLALADQLLRADCAGQITLHLKPQPFYVSDAMPQDVLAAIKALISSGDADLRALGARLQSSLAGGALQLADDAFWVSSLFFSEMPGRLAEALSQTSLAILKGDANYRRLVGDYHWPFMTPFSQAVRSFPTSAIALRTMKSELVVGLAEGVKERLDRADSRWLVDGKWGVAQFFSAQQQG